MRRTPATLAACSQRVHAGFTERTGLEMRTGTEPEMTWEGPGLEATFRPESSPAYHIEHLERGRPIFQKVIRTHRPSVST